METTDPGHAGGSGASPRPLIALRGIEKTYDVPHDEKDDGKKGHDDGA